MDLNQWKYTVASVFFFKSTAGDQRNSLLHDMWYTTAFWGGLYTSKDATEKKNTGNICHEDAGPRLY